MKVFSTVFPLICFLFLVASCFLVEEDSKTCKPSGKLRGKGHSCNKSHDSDCCEEGKLYDTYKCSPEVSDRTKAILTQNGFGSGEDGGGKCECDDQYHKDTELIVALSTGWYDKGKRCHKSVKAKVVDECDSTMGCDAEHDYQPPCNNNIVDALGVYGDERGWMEIYWSDA
ncbi:hypothetical protein PTKIN_Ptkin12aG0183700 [Pterospermum kingtungense]